MKASYSWLQSYLAEPLPAPEALAALLTEHVFEVEEIAAAGDDTVLDFKVLPDRAHYLLSHRGLAREIAVITGNRFVDRAIGTVPDTAAGAASVRIAEEGFCRRIVVRRFEGVPAATASEEIRARLAAAGQRSVNALVDVSNYVMLDIGQPSHVLDADKVVGELAIRRARPGERMTVLGGQEVALGETDWVVADDEGPLEVAGVKGGTRAAVTDATRNVIVHCGNYDPTAIRRTATRLNLRSDASKRFENEITPAFAEEGMARLSAMIMALGKGTMAGPVADDYPLPRVAEPFPIAASAVSAMLGEEVSAEEIADLMERMDCIVEREGDTVRVTPPTERFDLARPEDVADEVGRIRGYARLPGVLPPPLDTPQAQDPLFWYGERIKSVLVSRGYSEALLYSFVPDGDVSVTYPLAEDKAFLRTTLSERLVERLAFNRGNADLLGLDAIRLCEVGQVFPGGRERAAVAFGISVARKQKGIVPEDIVREDLRALSEALGIEVPDAIDSVPHGAVCEVDLSALLERLPPPGSLEEAGIEPARADVSYAPVVPYPFISRDVAVFVPEGVSREDVGAVVEGAAGPLRVRSWCFDEFVKQDGETARRSLAFRVVFQSPERTLEDADAHAAMAAVEGAFRSRGWEVR